MRVITQGKGKTVREGEKGQPVHMVVVSTFASFILPLSFLECKKHGLTLFL